MSPVLPAADSAVRQYAVFISYRHADNLEMGRKWANWLHEALESYEVPPDLVGKTSLRGDKVPASLYPVFRDEEELPADADLSTNIRRALENSRLLVVLCSPRAVQSRFVADEIRYFKEQGRSDRMLALMVDGEPNASDDPAKVEAFGAGAECFPEPLRFGVAGEGDATKIDWTARTEPIAADVRPEGRCAQGWTTAAAYREQLVKEGKLTARQLGNAVNEYHERLELAKLKIIAGALGLPLGELTQRNKAFQLAKAKRRQRVIATAAVVFGVLAVLAAGAGWIAWEKKIEVESERDKQDKLLWQASRADHEAAVRSIQEKRYAEGLAYFGRALGYRASNSTALAASANHVFGLSSPAWHLRQALGFREKVSCLTYSPDNRFLLIGSGGNNRGGPGYPGEIRIISARDGSKVSTVQLEGGVTSLDCSADGRFHVAGDTSGTARLFATESAAEISRIQFDSVVTTVGVSPDGQHYAAGSMDTTLRMVESLTGRETWRKDFQYRVKTLCFSPDGTKLVAGGLDNSIHVLQASTGASVFSTPSAAGVRVVRFSPDGRWVAVGSDDAKLQVFDAVSNETILTAHFRAPVTCIDFSAEGRYVAAGSMDGTAQLFEVSSRKGINDMNFSADVSAVSFSPDGRLLAVGNDKGAQIIETASGTEIWRTRQESDVAVLTFSPDGGLLAVGSSEGVRIFEAAAGRHIARFDLRGPATSFSYIHASKQLAAGEEQAVPQLFNYATGELVSQTIFKAPVKSFDFSQDGAYVAAAPDKLLQVLRTSDEKEISRAVLNAEILKVKISADGLFVGVSASDNSVHVFAAQTGKEVGHLTFQEQASSLSFSADGRYLMAADSTGFALFDLRLSKVLHQSTREQLTLVGFSPDARFFAFYAAADEDGDATARVIETLTGKEIQKADLDNCTSIASGSKTVDISDGKFRTMSTASDQVLGMFDCNKGMEPFDFDPSGTMLVTSSGQMFNPGNIFVVDLKSGNEIAHVVEGSQSRDIAVYGYKQEIERAVCFCPDGIYLVVLGGQDSVRVFDCRWFHADAEMSAVWTTVLSLHSNLRIDSSGKVSQQSFSSLESAEEALTKYIATPPKNEERWQHAILTWARQAPDVRPTSPWSDESVRSAIGRRLMQARKDTLAIADAIGEAPWHPLEPVSLARLESQLDEETDANLRDQLLIRSLFLARLTLKRMRAADENLYGRDTLAEYAAWCARIMSDELKLDTEALEALAFALERTPPEKQQDLIKLKAEIERP